MILCQITDQITDQLTDQNYKYSMLIFKHLGCWYPLPRLYSSYPDYDPHIKTISLISSCRFNPWSFSISNLLVEYLLDCSSEIQKLSYENSLLLSSNTKSNTNLNVHRIINTILDWIPISIKLSMSPNLSILLICLDLNTCCLILYHLNKFR